MYERKNLPNLTGPRIHLNGTSRQTLSDQYEGVLEALDKAIESLGETAPNARDYYPLGPGAYSRALGEHAFRVERLRAVQGELYWLRESLDEGDNAPPPARERGMARHTYARIEASELPAGLRWDVPPENQGQIVEVAYADDPPEIHPACAGSLYQRATDGSDRSVTHWRRVRG